MVSGAPPESAHWWKPAYSVHQAYAIDGKIDDGIANKGRMVSFHQSPYGSSGCSATRNTFEGADYINSNKGDDTLRCFLAYVLE